jgi:PAS domain S-box-containing protein
MGTSAADGPPAGAASAWQAVLAAGGDTGARMARHDWSATPLGPLEDWPQSLRTAVTICLHSRSPILLWWGPGLVVLHNDACQPILGGSERGALGRPGAEVWPEVWDVIGPMLEGVLAGAGATWSQDQPLLLDRDGFVQECFFTFSHSPVVDESGTPAGVFTVVTETTDRVVGDRRLRTLGDLAADLVDVDGREEVARRAVAVLAGNPADLPFVQLHLVAARADQQRADRRFRTLVEVSSAVVWTTDAAGAVVEPQPSWEAFTGQSWPEYAGTGWAAMVHPGDRDRVLAAWAAVLAARAPLFEVEARLFHSASGGYRHVATRAASQRDDDGDIAEWIGTIHDVDDRVAAEWAAKRTAAVSGALLDSAPVGFGLVDTELRYLQVNPALAALNGLPVEAHLGRRPSEVLPTYDARIEDLMRRALAEGPILGEEFSTEVATGGRVDMVASYFPIRIAGTGELVGLGFTVVDVTERTRLTEALAEQRNRFERLAATDVLAVFAGEGDLVTEANDAFLTMLGYTRGDVREGRLRWPELTPTGWEEADARAVEELRTTGRVRAYAKEYRHRDGHRVPLLVGVVAFEQEPLRWLAYAADLTAERAIQAELRLFQALVERSGDFIAVATPDGPVVYVNPAGRQLVGLGATDPVDGLRLVDFAAPDLRDGWRHRLEQAMRRDGHHRSESRLVRLDTGAQIEVDHQTFTVAAGDGPGRTAFLATVARDVGDRQRALRQAQTLGRLAGALSSARGRTAIVGVVAAVAPDVFDAAAVAIATAGPGQATLEVVDGTSPAGRQVDLVADQPLARAVRDNTVVTVGDPAGPGHTVCLPLRYGDGGPLGALQVRWSRPVVEDEELRDLLETVAGLCSQALQRAELTASAQAMAAFAARLSVTRSTREAIDVILTAAPVALGAVLPGLAVRETGRRVRLWHHGVPGTLATTFDDLTVDDPRPIAHALRTGQRVVVRDRAAFTESFPGLPDPVGAHGLVTTVAMPLLDAQRRPIAALGFGWPRERPLRDGDLALLDTIADLCEQTLERVRLAAAEHNLVTRLAGRLRTSSASIPPGLEIATRYRPAMSGLGLGGDWYDLVRLAGDRLAVVVGDVVGHRVEAAADMAQLRTMVNTLIRLGVPLGEVFPRLTDLVGAGFLGTCLVLAVDPAGGRVDLVRAGHPHPVLVRPGRPPVSVDTANALPLGMVRETMAVTGVPFGPGDLLVAYTDGLVERRDREYDAGVDALRAVLGSVRDEPVEAVADALMERLPGAEDDQALVVIRRVG